MHKHCIEDTERARNDLRLFSVARSYQYHRRSISGSFDLLRKLDCDCCFLTLKDKKNVVVVVSLLLSCTMCQFDIHCCDPCVWLNIVSRANFDLGLPTKWSLGKHSTDFNRCSLNARAGCIWLITRNAAGRIEVQSLRSRNEW